MVAGGLPKAASCVRCASSVCRCRAGQCCPAGPHLLQKFRHLKLDPQLDALLFLLLAQREVSRIRACLRPKPLGLLWPTSARLQQTRAFGAERATTSDLMSRNGVGSIEGNSLTAKGSRSSAPGMMTKAENGTTRIRSDAVRTNYTTPGRGAPCVRRRRLKVGARVCADAVHKRA